MYRLVEVNVGPIIYNVLQMCVVATHVVGKKTPHIVHQCYNKQYRPTYNIFLNDDK